MGEYLLRVKDLSKKYKGTYAVDHISVSFEKGKIYGLIGQNGAGKTTFMRILTGAIFQTSGEIEVVNKDTNKLELANKGLLKEFRRHMGSIVEQPALYANMSAKDNMIVHSRVCDIKEERLIDELLDKVGLGYAGKKKVRDFSLGMKQRLGMAIALLNSPEIQLD